MQTLIVNGPGGLLLAKKHPALDDSIHKDQLEWEIVIKETGEYLCIRPYNHPILPGNRPKVVSRKIMCGPYGDEKTPSTVSLIIEIGHVDERIFYWVGHYDWKTKKGEGELLDSEEFFKNAFSSLIMQLSDARIWEGIDVPIQSNVFAQAA